MADKLDTITGIVTQAFGFYTILPLTALKATKPANAKVKATRLRSRNHCRGITVGSYNVENLAPTSAHLPKVAAHLVDYLGTPDLLFIQEVQDDSGPTNNDGVVSANATLTALVAAISARSKVQYAFAAVDPAANTDGGQPGGNIRQAYLYRPETISLHKPNQGGAGDAAQVVSASGKDTPGGPTLSFNPGRIEPANAAWTNSRKPLAAAWVAGGASKPFYTVNVHWTSKGGGTSLHGDLRPPVNGGVEGRTAQANVTGVSGV